jgi:DNA-binding NarL/FixJ family response regulator
MSRIRIHIVDDHPVVRRGLKSLLSNYDDFKVVGESATVIEGKQHVSELMPDIVLLDVRLPGESGLDLLKWLREHHAQLKVLILTSFDDDEIVVEALQRGAHGFILKSSSDEMLCDAIRAVYRNGRVLSPQVTDQLIQQVTTGANTTPASTEFSNEEYKILRLLVDGASNDEIASKLYISIATVKRRLQKIFQKLDVMNRSTAIAETVRRKLLQ